MDHHCISILISFSLLCVSTFAQSSDSQKNADDNNHLGYDLMMSGNYQGAILCFDAAIKMDSTNSNYYHNKAYCEESIEDYTDAILDYKKAILYQPGNYEFHYLLGNIYQKLIQYDSAVIEYSDALASFDNRNADDLVSIYFNRGNSYLKMDNYISARSDYDKSVSLNQNHYPSYANRAITRYRTKDLQGACEDWYIASNNGIEVSEGYFIKHCKSIEIPQEIKQKEALKNPEIVQENTDATIVIETDSMPAMHSLQDDKDIVLTDPLEAPPVYPGGETERIKFLQQTLHYPDIARQEGIHGTVYLTFIIEKDGSIHDIQILKGIGGGCDEEAIRMIQAMPKWIPARKNGQPVSVRYNMSTKFVLEGMSDNDQDTDYQKGLERINAKEYEKAIKSFSKSIEYNGLNFRESYANRGICKYYLDDKIGAINDIIKAKDYNAQDYKKAIEAVFYNIATDFLKEKEFRKAISLFTETILANPNDKDSYYGRGIAYLQLSDTNNACADFTQAYKLGNNDAGIMIEKYCANQNNNQ
ncbi:MAG TPA: TonB family protein [Bacteroidales bacterium]|nr:TonB family protein [Bacteroidales bacterium]